MSADHAHGDHHHATPFWTMLIILIVLIILTVFTVLTAHYIDLGPFNFPLAMAIAVLKATLVFAFFMHLLYDKLINTVVVASTLFAVSLFIGITVVDLTSRARIDRLQEGEITAGGTDTVVKKAIEKAALEHHGAEHHEGDDHADDGHADESHAEDASHADEDH